MDATYHLGPDNPVLSQATVSGDNDNSAHSLHEEIQATGKLLHKHVDDLRRYISNDLSGQIRERLEDRLEPFTNPFGLNSSVRNYPLASCCIALVLGTIVGLKRPRQMRGTGVDFSATPLSRGIPLSRELGRVITSQLTSRFLERFLERIGA